jgi:hypothetical protein
VDDGIVARVEAGEVTALLIYGEISSERLRSIPLRRLGLLAARGADHQWLSDAPPPADAVQEAGTPKLTYVREPDSHEPETQHVPVEQMDQLIREELFARPGETVDDYYLRFANIFEAITPYVDSPNKRIAEALGMDPNVIKQYVHRARSRGFLPPVRREG